MKKLIVFDLDGTLAESKSAIDSEMSGLLGRLLAVERVAVISGGAFPQFEQQTRRQSAQRRRSLEALPFADLRHPAFYSYEGSTWKLLYAEDFSAEQKKKIIAALSEAVDKSGFKAEKTWGEAIEDRDSQITYSALGQQAPLDAKKTWDPDFTKRKTIKSILDPLLPDFAVNLGGSTSIDITKPGIDKAYGIRKLESIISIPIVQMLYVGDALFPGGNDYPARSTGADCIQVRDPNETKRVIEAIIACESP